MKGDRFNQKSKEQEGEIEYFANPFFSRIKGPAGKVLPFIKRDQNKSWFIIGFLIIFVFVVFLTTKDTAKTLGIPAGIMVLIRMTSWLPSKWKGPPNDDS